MVPHDAPHLMPAPKGEPPPVTKRPDTREPWALVGFSGMALHRSIAPANAACTRAGNVSFRRHCERKKSALRRWPRRLCTRMRSRTREWYR
jgi:hypothetical protein